MMMTDAQHFAGVRGKVFHELPLAKHTSWRCGGPAEIAFFPADRDDLAAFVRQLPAAVFAASARSATALISEKTNRLRWGKLSAL